MNRNYLLFTVNIERLRNQNIIATKLMSCGLNTLR